MRSRTASAVPRAPVGDRNREPEPGMSSGRRFRLAEDGDRRSRQEVEPPHGFHTNAKATDRRIGGHSPILVSTTARMPETS